MPNSIAEYYADELVDWNNAIHFYNKEMADFSKKLEEVIRRNSIVGIADKVEARETMFDNLTEKFYRLQIEIEQQEKALKTDNSFVDNTLISNETESRQNELRRKMQAIEKEYIDVKFDCYNFLSGTLKK